MKKIIPLSLIILFAGAFVYCFLCHDDQNNERKKFASFLLKAARNQFGNDIDNSRIVMMSGPEKAAFQNYLMTVDPALGYVPQDRLIGAYGIAQRLSLQKSGSAGLHWQSIPSNLGGRTRAVMWDPNDPQKKKVWAGGITGGLWYNNDITDPSSAWVPVSDLWSCLAIQCITFDPLDPKIFYAGTGEYETAMQQYRASGGVGAGIWKSTDGGQTWNQLPSTSGFAYTTDIVVRPEGTTSIVFAGVASGKYLGDHHSQPSDGLFRSADGGNAWEQVLPDIPGLSSPYSPSDIDITSDNSVIMVGTMPNINRNGGGTILSSATGLPGSWTVDESIKYLIETESDSFNHPGRVILASAASDPNIIYALVASGDRDDTTHFEMFWCKHIMRSADKGKSWVRKGMPPIELPVPNFAYIAWHALSVGVDPNNPNTLYIGGLDVHKSYDAGATWTRVSDWSLIKTGGGNRYVHGDNHTILYKPGSSDEILFGNDGGVFYTTTGTLDEPVFMDRNREFNTLQFYTCSINPQEGSPGALGGMQDMNTALYSGSPLSLIDLRAAGDGSACFFDGTDPSYYITSANDNGYVIYHNEEIVNNIFDYYHQGIFINPADYDSRTHTIYTNGVNFISKEPFVYQKISNVTTTGGYTCEKKHVNTEDSAYFSVLRVSPNSPSGEATLYLGSVTGRLYRITHAESTPVTEEITGSDFPAGNISCISIGSSDDTLLVTFSNYGVASVWLSYDAGQTWMNREGDLPDMPIRWAVMYPGHSKCVLLATETGVWSTGNLHQANVIWSPDFEGMPGVRVDMLDFRRPDNTVLAGTHGRGFCTAAWNVLESINDGAAGQVQVFPNPTTGAVYLNGISGNGEMTVRIMDQAGKILSDKSIVSSPGSYQKIADLTGFSRGIYIIRVAVENGISLNQKIIRE